MLWRFYEISQSIVHFPRFETLAWDLWGMDYEAVYNEQFSTAEPFIWVY